MIFNADLYKLYVFKEENYSLSILSTGFNFIIIIITIIRRISHSSLYVVGLRPCLLWFKTTNIVKNEYCNFFLISTCKTLRLIFYYFVEIITLFMFKWKKCRCMVEDDRWQQAVSCCVRLLLVGRKSTINPSDFSIFLSCTPFILNILRNLKMTSA